MIFKLLLLIGLVTNPFDWHENFIPLPNPKSEEQIIIPIPKCDLGYYRYDPVKRA